MQKLQVTDDYDDLNADSEKLLYDDPEPNLPLV